MVEIAECIARAAHAGQFEESTGEPYVRHLERVAAMVEGQSSKSVAWLHDVVEDTPVRAWDLLAAGISAVIVNAVVILTRDKSETYAEYIQRIKESDNSLALVVKIADLRDHFRPSCPEQLRERLWPRYEKAWAVLTWQPLPESVRLSGFPEA